MIVKVRRNTGTGSYNVGFYSTGVFVKGVIWLFFAEEGVYKIVFGSAVV